MWKVVKPSLNKIIFKFYILRWTSRATLKYYFKIRLWEAGFVDYLTCAWEFLFIQNYNDNTWKLVGSITIVAKQNQRQPTIAFFLAQW